MSQVVTEAGRWMNDQPGYDGQGENINILNPLIALCQSGFHIPLSYLVGGIPATLNLSQELS